MMTSAGARARVSNDPLQAPARKGQPDAAVALAPGAQHHLRRYDDVRQLIASVANPTPILQLRRVIAANTPPVFLKLEWFNPFGSIKDRTALYLLEGLAARGELDDKELVEPTSGNTGIALAALAALMGKKITITIPEGVPPETQVLLRMLGAEVWPTPDDLCPIDHPKDGAISLARSFVSSEATRGRYVMPNQYESPDNVQAHYATTGPEIWRQTEGQVRYFFAGFGTCGTLVGVGRYLKEQNPEVQVIAIEPQRGHRLPGLKNMQESREPAIMDRSVIDDVVRVEDGPAHAMTKRLYREEGLLVGASSGAIALAAALYPREGLSVCVSPDGGAKYASLYADLLGDEGNPAG